MKYKSLYNKICMGLKNNKLVTDYLYYELIEPLYRAPSRFLFGNYIGYRLNIYPILRRAIRRISFDSSLNHKPNTGSFILLREGFLRLPQLNKTISSQAALEFELALANPLKTRVVANGLSTVIFEPCISIPSIGMMLNSDLDTVLRNYFLGNYKISTVRAWQNRGTDKDLDPHTDVGISNGFHFDGADRDIIRMFILLSDNVSVGSGSTKMLNIQDSKEMTRNIYFFSRKFLPPFLIERILSRAKYFEGDCGDIMLLNTQRCLHGSSILMNSSERNIIALSFEACKEYIPYDEHLNHVPRDSQNI